VTNAIAEMTVGSPRQPKPHVGPHPLLIATDGTAQSDGAVRLARLLAADEARLVRVVTVVDHAPIPWGAVDRALVLDYERGTQEEAQKKASAQLRRLGGETWQVEVRTGNPATLIAAMAEEWRPRMIVVGLGGHGPAARFFGNETALRLMRISQTPVLAVDAEMSALPSRMLVAMDFSESSIEAARLALEIAAPEATLTLVHVVPWERKEYIPEHWFRDHEAYIAGQLKRVGGWLDHNSNRRIHQKVLYGKPGPALLAFAEDLDADLIVAGTHGRNLFGRMLGGETVSKLVRGARRSVLVVPHAAAFQIFDQPPRPSAHDDQKGWVQKLDEFSRRNRGRRSLLEINDPAVGAQVEMKGYRVLGATYDVPSKRVQLMFGSTESAEPHLVRGISNVKSVEILADENDSDTALSIVNDEGQTLLLLEAVKEPS
jgi:nucleotide-binding universal stress UspA family protein